MQYLRPYAVESKAYYEDLIKGLLEKFKLDKYVNKIQVTGFGNRSSVIYVDIRFTNETFYEKKSLIKIFNLFGYIKDLAEAIQIRKPSNFSFNFNIPKEKFDGIMTDVDKYRKEVRFDL